MKNLIFTHLFLIMILIPGITTVSLAQAPDTIWARTYGGASGDRGYDIQPTSDDGYIICGETFSFGAGSSDAWLIRINANGDTLWAKTYGDGGSSYESAKSVIQTSDDGFVFTGTAFTSSSNVYLVRTDQNGDTLWTRTIGSFSTDAGYSVQQTSDGGYIICGETRSFHSGFGSSVWIIRTDANGDTLWTKTYGGSSYQGGYSISETADGGFVATGSYNNGGSVSAEVWLLRMDANGDTLWTKTFGGDSSQEGHTVLQTSDGGYIVAGSFGFNYIWLIRTDNTGDTLWANLYLGGLDRTRSLVQTSDDGFVITCGNIDGDLMLIRIDGNGGLLWNKTLGGVEPDNGSAVLQTADGGFIVCGSTESYGAGNSDVWVVRLNPDGSTGTDDKTHTSLNSFDLLQNYPNPFNPETKINYYISKTGFVSLKIYDALGNEVKNLVNKEQSAGTYIVHFNAEGLSSGIYFYKLQTESFVKTRKMVLLK